MFFFFFKQKTAYEMRISDWSSDVCSSDLIALHDLSAATSGNYRRGFSAGGWHYSHSFDPATGRPIVNGVASVTVLHRSCMLADGWATALTVLGPETAMSLADEQSLDRKSTRLNSSH